MSPRWTEDDLATFQRNSGRGLPASTIQQMEKAHGVKLDANGNPVPQTVAERKRLENLEAARSVKSVKAKKASKFGNQPVLIDGQRFDSKLEGKRYLELKLMKAAGEVLYFLRQVPFLLPGGVIYRVDFEVIYPLKHAKDPRAVWIGWEDCKGHDKRESMNKIKMVKDLYGVTVELVRKARG